MTNGVVLVYGAGKTVTLRQTCRPICR